MKFNASASRVISIFMTFSLFFFAVSCSQPDKVETRQELKNPLLAYAKLPAPKILGEKLNMLVTELDPTGQAAMMMPMFLQSYGYPNFDGISDTDTVNLFILGEPEEEEFSFLLFIKASQETPLVTFLMGLPEMQMQQEGEWLIFADSPEDIASIVDTNELLGFAGESANYDIQLTTLTDSVIDLREKAMEDLEKEFAASEEVSEDTKAFIKGFVGLVFDEMESIKTMEAGINISPEALAFAFNMEALGGTPLGKFLSQNPSGSVKGGQYIPSNYSMAGVVDFDPDITVEYWNYILDKVIAFAPPSYKAEVTNFKEVMASYTASVGSLSGFAFDFKDFSAQTIQYVEGDLSDDQVHALYEYMAEGMVPRINELMQSSGDPELKDFSLTGSYQRDAGELMGVTYHRYIQEMNMPEVEGDELPPEMQGMQTQEYYVVLHDGDLLLTTSEALLGDLLDAVINKKPVSNSVANLLSDEPGAIAQINFDIISYYNNIFESMPEGFMGEPEGAQFMAIIQMLKSAGLPGVKYFVYAQDNQGALEFEMPMTTLKLAVETIAQGMAAANAGGNPGTTPGM